ncbi:MAG: hypothetical protein QXK76_00350 [Candidatus Woesearchaeota archaeon]
MLSESEIKNLIAELNSLKSEIKDLRQNLHNLDYKKEELFREKKKVSSDIFSRIKNARENKTKRDSLTGVVKNTKLTKEEMESEIERIEEEIKKLKEEKKRLTEKLGVDDPLKIKSNIRKIEFKIETEALSFEKEKELMKVLQKLKKQYDSSKSILQLNKKLDLLFRESKELKSQLDMTKKIVQASVRESQKHHHELIESTKEIDELRKKDSELEDKISKIKNEMHKIIEELDKRNLRVSEIKKLLNENNVQLKEDFEKANQQLLKHKDEEVKEKLKSGKKLTTEDLLILQRTMN